MWYEQREMFCVIKTTLRIHSNASPGLPFPGSQFEQGRSTHCGLAKESFSLCKSKRLNAATMTDSCSRLMKPLVNHNGRHHSFHRLLSGLWNRAAFKSQSEPFWAPTAVSCMPRLVHWTRKRSKFIANLFTTTSLPLTMTSWLFLWESKPTHLEWRTLSTIVKKEFSS